MSKFTSFLFASVCATLLLTGCSGKDGDPGPAGPAGPSGPAGPAAPVLTGNLFGFVGPISEVGTLMARNGILVTVEGVTPAITATTDVNGRYEFPNLRAGTYNLVYSRSDLSTNRRIIAHIGGDQPTFAFTTTVTQASSTRISDLTATTTSTSIDLLLGLFNQNIPVGGVYRYAVYISSNPTITATDGIQYGGVTYGVNKFTDDKATVANPRLAASTLNSMGFASGTQVYAVVFGLPVSFPAYTDLTTGRGILTGLGAPSQVVKFTIP